jgi:hypothetical protein
MKPDQAKSTPKSKLEFARQETMKESAEERIKSDRKGKLA